MQLGVIGFVPADPALVDEAAMERVRREGFTGLQLFFPDPWACSDADVERLRALVQRHGLQVAQCNGAYPFLVDPDDQRRQQGVDTLRQLIRLGAALGAQAVYVRPGSVNPAGPWQSHRENRSAETRRRLLSSLGAAAETAEELGAVLALEGHVLSPLPTPESLRDVVRAVGSPALRCNLDPVNFVGSLEDAYDTTGLLDRLFACVGEYAVAGHIKDVTVGSRLVLHLDEVIPGQGLLDLPGFFSRLAAALPAGGFALIEHLADADIPAARKGVLQAAAAAGVRFGEA